MRTYRAVLLAVLVVGGTLAATAPASADSTDDLRPAEVAERVSTDAARQSAQANNSSNASLGGDISSFMQSSVAEMGGEVESEMWEAAFNGTENRSEQSRLVDRRTRELERELNDVRERKQEIIEKHENGAISDTAYRAQLSSVVGRIDALRSAINETQPRAEQVNTDVEELRNLSDQAEKLSGPEIAELARNTTGNGLGNAPGAGAQSANETDPPSAVGNASEDVGNGSAAQSGESRANPGNGEGQPDEAGKPVEDAPENESLTVGPSNASDGPGPARGNGSPFLDVTKNGSIGDGFGPFDLRSPVEAFDAPAVGDAFDASGLSPAVPSVL